MIEPAFPHPLLVVAWMVGTLALAGSLWLLWRADR